MKEILFTIFIFLSLLISAQQHPSYTQYNLNRYSINPALAGIQSCGESIMGHRKQWVGFENAPTTYYMSFNTRHNNKDKYPKNFHGYGFNLIGERYGFTSNYFLKLGYAYNMVLQRNYRVSFGLFAGIQNFNQNYNNIRIANRALDPALKDEESVFVYPDISPGIFLYNKNLFLGASLMQGFPARIKNFGSKENRLSNHIFLTSGYRFRGREIDVIPSFLFYIAPLVSPTMDMNLSIDVHNMFLVGLGSKYLNSAYLNFELKVFRKIHFGYAYEYALNRLSKVSPTTHEFAIRIKSCNEEKKFEKFICPAYE